MKVVPILHRVMFLLIFSMCLVNPCEGPCSVLKRCVQKGIHQLRVFWQGLKMKVATILYVVDVKKQKAS